MIVKEAVEILILASALPGDLDSKISCLFFSGEQSVLPVLGHLARNEDGNKPQIFWEDPLALPYEIPYNVVFKATMEIYPRKKQGGEDS